ncbi:hypothetical protein [Labedella endophytica]|uniref:DUF2238 domain-containing protein n=1 Tax=Labedella endophytica TaxID=1523160 RepID=A0A3S0VH11_9MICO|nr:hypothetical protein [Labedella endophytica]RUR01708.1 hypothetical protein ELQ94_09590 [Labedella endophytica]
MIANFLRRPVGAVEILADVVRLVGLLSVLVAFIWWEPTDAGVLALVLPALLLPRFIGVHPGFDVVYGVILLVAGWSNVFDLYTSISWWDLAVHVACTGVVAVLVFLLLARLGIIASPRGSDVTVASTIVLTTIFGLAASAVWEMIEWLGKEFVSSDIFVEYDDTIGDMAVGGLGALAAGVALALLPLHRYRSPDARDRRRAERLRVG